MSIKALFPLELRGIRLNYPARSGLAMVEFQHRGTLIMKMLKKKKKVLVRYLFIILRGFLFLGRIAITRQ